MAEMLKIDNIHKTFHPGTINEKHALNGVCLSLDEGDFVTVIGGNGAGKSTLARAFGQLIPVKSLSAATMSHASRSTNAPDIWAVFSRIR